MDLFYDAFITFLDLLCFGYLDSGLSMEGQKPLKFH